MKLLNKLIINCILLSFLFSCTEKSLVKVKNSMTIVTPKGLKLDFIQEDKWRVGPLRKQTMSKGVRIGINLPVLKNGDLKGIIKKHKVNSWILKVKQQSSFHSRVLGHIYFPMFSPGRNAGSSLRIKQLEKGIFGIYYRAASVSTRLSKLSCPAFNHEYRVFDLKEEEESLRSQNIFISHAQSKKVSSKVEKFDNRIVLNGGENLRGSYSFEIASYNYETKMRSSNWAAIPGRAIVGLEKKINLKGCEGATVLPLDEKNYQKSNTFKFGN